MRKLLTSLTICGILLGIGGASVSASSHPTNARQVNTNCVRKNTQHNHYLRSSSFKKHAKNHWTIKTKKYAFVHSSKHYTKGNRSMGIEPGYKLRVARVICLSHHNHVYRFLLNDGQYFTANTKYVRVI